METLTQQETLLRAIARMMRAAAAYEDDLWATVQEAREAGVPVASLLEVIGCSRATLYRRIGQGDPF